MIHGKPLFFKFYTLNLNQFEIKILKLLIIFRIWILVVILALVVVVGVCSCCVAMKNRSKQRTMPMRNAYPVQPTSMPLHPIPYRGQGAPRGPPGPPFQTIVVGPGIYYDLRQPTSTTG